MIINFIGALKHSKLAPHFAVVFEACQDSIDFLEAFSFVNKRYRRIQERSLFLIGRHIPNNWRGTREIAEQSMGIGASLPESTHEAS